MNMKFDNLNEALEVGFSSWASGDASEFFVTPEVITIDIAFSPSYEETQFVLDIQQKSLVSPLNDFSRISAESCGRLAQVQSHELIP